jgi:hypothetical protein
VKSVKNFRYVEKTSVECNEDSYLAILYLSRVELHCKLQEKLHRVTWPLSTRCVHNRLAASLSTSCNNAVILSCCNKVVTYTLLNCRLGTGHKVTARMGWR